MKLLIAIPCMDTVPVAFMQSLLKLTQKLTADGVDYTVGIESGTLVYMARDRLAGRAVNQKYTHVLWLDSDMVFEPELLEDLQFSGKDFVTGIAHGRRKPFVSCLFKNIDLDHLELWQLEDYPKETFEVAGCGMACCLMSTEVIKQVMINHGTAFNPIPRYGEDLSFCKRAKEMGFRIWAEPTVRLGHIAHIAVYPDDVPRYRDEIQRD
jgi:hypothetical protein